MEKHRFLLHIVHVCLLFASIDAHCPDCTHEYAPVCATNGGIFETFYNYCHMLKTECQTGKDYVKLYDGKCTEKKECKDIYRCTKSNKPVCAIFNGEFVCFQNECILHKTNCETQIEFVKLFHGKCPPENKVCPVKCTGVFLPVCASNGGPDETFLNECFMYKKGCETNTEYKIKSRGECPPPECPVAPVEQPSAEQPAAEESAPDQPEQSAAE